MSTPKAHAKFAASSSERWMNCPASMKLAELCPPSRSGAAAVEGTKAHELMERALEMWVKDVVTFFENDNYPLDMREHVQVLVDFVRENRGEHDELLIEQKTFLDFIHPTDMFGTVDVAIIEPFGSLHIIDYKHGVGYVNHKENPQMMYYALGLAHERNYDFDSIKTTIVQPRGGSKAVRTFEFDTKLLFKWRDKFKEAVERCETANITDVVEGSWCKWCPAKLKCPALSTKSLVSAKLAFATPVQPEPKDLSASQLKAVLDRAEYIELWIDEVKKYAEERVRNGDTIPGWGLVPKRAMRQWVDESKILNSDAGQLITVKNLLSPAQAEKVLKKVMGAEGLERFMKSNVVAVSSGDKFDKLKNDYDSGMLDTFPVND